VGREQRDPVHIRQQSIDGCTLHDGQSGENVGSSRALFPIPNIAESDWLLYPTTNTFVAASNGQPFLVG
jgi:hypothetical protein